MAEDETQKAVEEILDAEVEVVDDPTTVVDSLSEPEKIGRAHV